MLLLGVLLPISRSPAEEHGDAQAGGVWIDVYQGEPLRYEELLQDLATADVVYLGECHTLQRHHEIQARLVSDLAHRGAPLALGLEQMESSRQLQLDRYNRAEIDFEQLAEATAWPKRWPNYRQYQPILDAARKAQAPVIALNAGAETIRQVVRSGGIERMPPQARQQLPAQMQLQDPVYEKLLSLQMMVHASAAPETLRPMIEAQIARDEAMAQALSAFMKSDSGRGRKMLVLCGSGHVAYGQGMPTRVRRRLPGIRDRIVLLAQSGEARLSPEEMAQSREIEITHEQLREIQQPVADYLFVKPVAAKPPVDPGPSAATQAKERKHGANGKAKAR